MSANHKMTHRERAIAALECRTPDMIPHYELAYHISMLSHGKKMLAHGGDVKRFINAGYSDAEMEYKLEEYANVMAEVFTDLEWSIIPLPGTNERVAAGLSKYLHKILGDSVLLCMNGDGTFAIPGGDKMYDFVYRIADDPDEVHEEAKTKMQKAIERNKRMHDAGIECFQLCSDYCYNSGPFLSPEMFSEFITPYLAQLIDEIRKMGGYAIKHTDGNIMPILDQLMECRPHAIHSIDPMAGVDIAEVKKLTREKGIAICGNVDCSKIQTGTDDEIRESALYAIECGKPGGGYIYCSSNCVFTGVTFEKYKVYHDVWKQHREY